MDEYLLKTFVVPLEVINKKNIPVADRCPADASILEANLQIKHHFTEFIRRDNVQVFMLEGGVDYEGFLFHEIYLNTARTELARKIF